MPFLAPCDCRTASATTRYLEVWIRHHPEKPSARKAKQAKTRLRAAYDTGPRAPSIENRAEIKGFLGKRSPAGAHFPLRPRVALLAMLLEERQHRLVERRRVLPHVGVPALGGRELRARNERMQLARQVHRDEDVLGAGQHHGRHLDALQPRTRVMHLDR